jgi:hypothetical protein
MSPDPVVGRSRMGDIEDRLGIDRLDLLMAQRADLVEQVATLRARHGTFGLADAERTIELARIAGLIRAQALRDKTPRFTVDEMKAVCHAHPDYMEWVTQATIDRANLYRLENKITDINDLIYRGNVLARFAASEARL